jgi:hypothetical protein
MAKLPFVVAPKSKTKIVQIGNEEVGMLEIEKRGYLTVAEKSFVDSVMQNSDGIANLVRLASKIGRKRKITSEKAYMLLLGVIDGTNTTSAGNSIADEYGTEIAEIQSQMSESVQRKLIAVTTILIQTRINSEWTIEDTMTLQPGLLEEFGRFYDTEEQKVDFVETNRDPLDEAADIVGK